MATSMSCLVREVLDGENYLEWSVVLKNYLRSQDLWDDVIEDTQNSGLDEKSKSKKDAAALHAIQISCNSETFTNVIDAKSAKEAWNELQRLYKGQSLDKRDDIEQGLIQNSPLKELRELIHKGNWGEISRFTEKERHAIYDKTSWDRNVLHMAVIAGHDDIMKKLLSKVPDNLRYAPDINGWTALSLAAVSTNNTEIADCLIDKHPGLLIFEHKDSPIPAVLAAEKGNKKMARYLYRATIKNKQILNMLKDSSHHCSLLFARCIQNEIFDVASDLLDYFENSFLTVTFNDLTPSCALVHKFPDIPDQISPKWKFWNHIGTTGKEMREKKLKRDHLSKILRFMSDRVKEFNDEELREYKIYEAVLLASKTGAFKFIESMTAVRPDLFSVIDESYRGIFAYAILNRQAKVLSLVNKLNEGKDLITSRVDVFGNTLLHLAAKKGPTTDLARECGPAMQIQNEFQWFKAVEEIVPPQCKEIKNNNGKKPQELFLASHDELLKEAGSWAENTARSYALVGTLNITIMFASALKGPAASDHGRAFTLFILADTLSLFASLMAVLIFIGIMSSRFTEYDFHKRMPTMLLAGVFALLVGLTNMMIAFMAALPLLLTGYLKTLIIVLFPILSIPIVFHVKEQFIPVMKDIVVSTYFSEIESVIKQESQRDRRNGRGSDPLQFIHGFRTKLQSFFRM